MTARIPDIGNVGVRFPATVSLPASVRFWHALGTVAADLGAVLMALAVSAALTGTLASGGEDFAWHDAITMTALLLAAVMLYFAQQGHYTTRLPFWSSLGTILAGSAFGLVFSLITLRIFRSGDLAEPVLAWLIFPIIVLALRRVVRAALTAAGLWELRAVIVGSAEAAVPAINALMSEPALGYSIAGVVRPEALAGTRTAGVWRSVLKQHRAGLLVLAPQPLDGLDNAAEALVRERVPFAIVPRPDGLPVQGLIKTAFFSHDTIMFSYRNNLAQPVSRLVKVGFDMAVASVLLVVLSPAFAAVALLVSLDGGSVFYRHMRVGVGGREFPCMKFRSMVRDGDTVLRRTLASNPDAAAEWRETRKLKNDPRVTWIGRHLRSTSLDELPQLLNVLRMEMSLVGPRPIVQAEVERYGDDIAYYFEARPGLTGLWQVSGRSEIGYAQRVRLDTWYVKNWTMWNDLAILAKTIPAVLARRGAV